MVSVKESFQPFLQQRNGVCFPGKTLFPWAPDRIFKSGEMLWWDEKHPAKLVFFASGGLQCQPEILSSSPRALNASYFLRRKRPDPWSMGVPQELAYQCKRLKQTSSTPLRSVPPATARPFAAAPETFPVIAAAAKEKSWFNSHRGRAPRVTVQVRGEHWVGLNIVGFVPEEVGKIQRSSRHAPSLD